MHYGVSQQPLLYVTTCPIKCNFSNTSFDHKLNTPIKSGGRFK